MTYNLLLDSSFAKQQRTGGRQVSHDFTIIFQPPIHLGSGNYKATLNKLITMSYSSMPILSGQNFLTKTPEGIDINTRGRACSVTPLWLSAKHSKALQRMWRRQLPKKLQKQSLNKRDRKLAKLLSKKVQKKFNKYCESVSQNHILYRRMQKRNFANSLQNQVPKKPASSAALLKLNRILANEI